MGDPLGAREEAILLGLLTNFLETREPVPSRCLASEGTRHLSPATVRNILVRLDEAGYLHQPHPSAGRVPTELAYRYMAERLLHTTEPEPDTDWSEVDRLSSEGNLNALARMASNALAESARVLGFAVTCPERELKLRACELVAIAPLKVMCVVVSRAGQVLEAVLRAQRDYTPEELRWFSNYLSATYEGLSFAQIRQHLLAQIEGEERECGTEIGQALALVAPYFLDPPIQRELFWEGAAWLLDSPDFADNLRAVKTLLESLQRKKDLLDLLDQLSKGDRSLRVVLGDDWPDPASRGLAMVVAPFGADPHGLGVVGVIGPQALRYDTTIPVVRRMARLATLASERL